MYPFRPRPALIIGVFILMLTLMACSLGGSPKPFEGPVATPTYPPVANNISTPTLPPVATPTPANTCTISTKFDQTILRWCSQIMTTVNNYPNLKPDLLAAIIRFGTTTGENLAPTPRNQAVGLMQIMPSDSPDPMYKPYFANCAPGQKGSDKPYNFDCRPTVQELLDPAFNLDYGGALLSHLLKTNNNDLRAALLHYGGSQAYVDGVMHFLEK